MSKNDNPVPIPTFTQDDSGIRHGSLDTPTYKFPTPPPPPPKPDK